MSRLEQMRSYLPEFMIEFEEIDRILIAEWPEFDLAAERTWGLLNQMFIETATEEGLAKYEGYLGIKAAQDDLEKRRQNVLALWFSDMPFTLRALIQRLRALQGNEDATAWVEEFLLHVKTDLSTAEEMRSARKIIDNMIPANLELQFDFETVVPDITAWYGCATLYSGKSTLQVDSTVDPTELSWLTDEDSGVLTDEYGIILFE